MQSTNATHAVESPTRPPAQPVYILRGHESSIHALTFFWANARLASGDADGWLVVWDVAIRRPTAVWQPHSSSILGISPWGHEKLITQGRDQKIRVWKYTLDEERSDDGLSKILPAENPNVSRKEPWLFHSITVSTLNFCSFSFCYTRQTRAPESSRDLETEQSRDECQTEKPLDATKSSVLLATAGLDDSGIDIYELPSETKVACIPAPQNEGQKTGMLMSSSIFYSSAHTPPRLKVAAAYESGRAYVFQQSPDGTQWLPVYTSRPHSQPILSLDVLPGHEAFYTSGADAIIAKHKLAETTQLSDEEPLKTANTKHSGQQGLTVRSDGRILATAGWDSRLRIYSAKTLKEVAVLKWHKVGCYSVAFAELDVGSSEVRDADSTDSALTLSKASNSLTLTSGNLTVRQARERKTKTTHWLAAGSKDGKISLWDIF